MAFLCIGCFKDYIIRTIPNNWTCHCGGGITDIDDMMVLPIKQLNARNLKTMFCCSGHPNDGNPMIPYVMISLTDSFVLPEYIGRMSDIGDDLFIPDDIDTFIDHVSSENNFKEIYEHFYNSGFNIEISYHTQQYKLRMTLRYSTLPETDVIYDLNMDMNDSLYQEWLNFNYKFYEYTKSCPMAINHT